MACRCIVLLPELGEDEEQLQLKAVIGTQTNNQETNYLFLVDVTLPHPDETVDGTPTGITIGRRILHDKDVHEEF